MSYRGSFTTEFIYDPDLAKKVYEIIKECSETAEDITFIKNSIISGFIKHSGNWLIGDFWYNVAPRIQEILQENQSIRICVLDEYSELPEDDVKDSICVIYITKDNIVDLLESEENDRQRNY